MKIFNQQTILKFYMFKNYADTPTIMRWSSTKFKFKFSGKYCFFFSCLTEQTEIVRILESKLSACDQLATTLSKQLKQAELLKQRY